MSDFGLSERATKTITDILAKYPEVEQAIIYGSQGQKGIIVKVRILI
ncbi:DNA polymerase beta domain protein region [Bibersteinia trehalosi USDA-ARS-USMARC-190]|uniref:DNA polymerase beta domain protein region n=1 Tax=Bibersteinia trehalosi USDA-ARS-USMARC-190 TaxID=1263832 RepID=W0R6J8_BIBTR|nr:hypothetical protein [Bibersteinia trehalosi]AHG85915.1 DNA polymerase beta domain protein region [Bibersteinia trehalosi USDA-ARS-USMARC-190]